MNFFKREKKEVPKNEEILKARLKVALDALNSIPNMWAIASIHSTVQTALDNIKRDEEAFPNL